MYQIFRSKYFWIGIAILIVVIIIYRKFGSIKQAAKNITQQQDIDFEDGESVKITQTRKDQLQKAAQGMFNDIYEKSIGRNPDPYIIANSATDNELRFLAKYYSSNLSSGKSLWEDMNGEYYRSGMWETTDGIKVRLAKMGLR